MARVEGANDGGVGVGVGDGGAEQEFGGGHAIQQVVESGAFPALPHVRAAASCARFAAGHAAADHDADAGRSRCADGVGMFGLQDGVGDLQHVEHVHGDVVEDVGQD